MSKLISLCLFLLFCVVFGQNTPVTLGNQVSDTVLPCQYKVYELNITGAAVSNYLSFDFDTNSTEVISVEISDVAYATWGETSDVSYVGSGSTFTINILCDYTTVSTWYIAITAANQAGNIVPVNYTFVATQESVVVAELALGQELTVSPDGRTNVFGPLTDFFHASFSGQYYTGQYAKISVTSSDSITRIYANTDALAANFDQNICLLADATYQPSVLTIDSCTFSKIYSDELYFTVIPSANTSYTITISFPTINPIALTPTATPWSIAPVFDTLASNVVNYYNFTVSNTTTQVLNITINNVQGGSVAFSYSTTQYPFIDCETGSNCVANSPNCCTDVSTSCQLVVQPCNVQTFYYVAVEALSYSSSSYPITYEIQVSNTALGSVTELANSVFVSSALSQAHYDQYIFDNNGYKIDDETTLSVHLYVDQSNSAIQNLNTTLFVNYNDVAGSGLGSSCWDSYLSCTITNVGSCTIQLNPCILNDYDEWYVSVYTGYSNNFYGRDVSYTLLADLVEPVELEDPYLVINSVLYKDTFDHYTVNSDLLPSNGGFNLVVFNVLGGNLNVYLNYGGLAGPLNTCPSCFNNTEYKVATPASALYFPVTNCDDESDENSDEVYFSVYSQNLASVSYSLTVEEIKNYKPNDDVKSGTPYVASIGPQSSLNYTIPGSSSDSYLLVSITQIDNINTPLSIKLYNATSLSCVDSESLLGSANVNGINQYASIIIPECDYNFGDGYILVVENNSPNNINYNVYYETPSSTPYDLGNNEAYSDLVPTNGREFFTYSPSGEDTLLIEVYFDVCKDINGAACVGTLSLTTIDPDTDTGCIASESVDFQTSDTKSCVFVRTTCNTTSGDLYMIVSTTSVLYPDAPLGYTILVSEFNSSVPIQPGKPMNMNIYPNQRIYHTFSYSNSTTNYLPTVNLRLSNQQNGTVSAVLAQTPPPNAESNCPCFDYSSLTTVEYCNAQSGEWSALVQASAATSNQLVGYTISLQELSSSLTALTPQSLSAQSSLSPLQYAFFDVRSIDWSLPTIISVVPTGGSVAVYTTTSANPGTSQCGPRTQFCAATSSACTQQLSACNSASGNPTFISVQGVSATSFDSIGFSITLSQQPAVMLTTNQESALQQIPANVFYEYNYQLPVTFTAPLVGFALNNISVSTGFSVEVYNELGCFNEPLTTKTCTSAATCNLEVSSCDLAQNSTLYIIVQATGSPLNFTITPSFVDLVPVGGNIPINTPTALVVNPNSYTVFTTTITNAAPQYSLSYVITTNTTGNNLEAYANWNTVTPDCSIWSSRFSSGAVANTFSSCCVQAGTFSVLVFSPVYANLTITFTQVQRLTATVANPAVNVTTPYALSPQQTQEFSITLNPTSYYDFFFVTVAANASSNFYFQHAGLAGPSNGVRACYANSFSCTTELNCVYKVPQCAFSTGIVDPFVAGTLNFAVQNLQNQPNTPLELTINYGTLSYVTLTDSTAAPVTVQPYLAAYGIFPLTTNSVNQSVVINVDSAVTPFSFNIYTSDCTTNPPLYNIPCVASPCNISVSTCGGVSNFLVEVLNPSDTPFDASITAIVSATFVPSPLSLTPVLRTDASTEYFSYEITVQSSTEYGQLVIYDYTANPNQLTVRWSITGVPVCFQTIPDIIWTDNSNGTSTANVILNSCLLTTGTYVFELISSVPANYSIAFDPLQQGDVTQIGVPANEAGEIRVNERALYNLTIDPNTVKPGQSIEIAIQNKCGSAALYLSQGTYAGPECGGIPIQSASISACDLLYTPLSAQGDNALYLTVIGDSQSNSQYDIPAQYLITVDVTGEPVEFVNVGLDEIVNNGNNGNTIYVFAVSGVDSFVGQIQIAINELENGGATDLYVSMSESTLCRYDFLLSNINGGDTSYFINSCQANDARLIYLQFSGNNTESKFQISHTRPFIRDLDTFDEQPQNGAVVPSVNTVNAFMDEEYYSISLTEKEIENFLFTAWVANEDDDDSLAQQQAGIQLTASQASPPSLCVSSSNSEYHSASFGNKLSWEWCEVDMEASMYLTVNYPTNVCSNNCTEAYPYSLYWSFGLDDEDVTTLEPNTPSCALVEGGETNYYVFQLPVDTSTSIFNVEVYAINADTDSCGTSLDVSVAYGGLASSRCNLGSGFTQTCSAPCGSQSSSCLFSLNCPIEDWEASNTNISVSVYAPGTNDVSYFIEFFDTPTNAVTLNLTGPVITSGGDSSSAYYFTVPAQTLDATSTLILNVEPINGNSLTTMWYAYNHIPTTSCYDGTCSETTGCQIMIDACTIVNETIVIAVASGAQFYISASVSTAVATPIAVNAFAENNFASTAPLGSVYTYSVNITDTDIANSLFGELAVLVYGVNQGSVTAWISYGSMGNPTNCYLDKQVISATPNGAPLPAVLTINACSFTTGLYYVSLELTARLDNCSSTTFGLIPSIGTLDVAENVLTAGTAVEKPIPVGSSSTEYYSYTPSSAPEILYLLIDAPEDISYQIEFWTSPYGKSVDNGAGSCAASDVKQGATSYYWWGCMAQDSIRFQITFNTPDDLSVLPGATYTVTANSLSSVELSENAVSAEIDVFYQVERFYTFTADTSNSFVIDIELTQGPAIEVAVYGTNCTDDDNVLVTSLTCYYGPCSIPIDWSTAGFENNTQYYLVVTGIAPSQYSITLLSGEDQTCVAATNASLCTMVDWNVWDYGTGEAGFEQQNAASIVLYNNLVAKFCPPCECVELSSSCNDSLIEFACTQTYRACDTTGLQASICQDSCEDIEENCGYTFEEVGLPQYSCNHNFYYTDSDGNDVCDDIYGINDTSGDKLLWLIVLIVVALILIVLIAVGAFIFYKKYQQAKRTGSYEAIQDANESDSSSSSINSTE